MTPEAQRIAIAYACGWTSQTWGEKPHHTSWITPEKTYGECPYYLADLNAMHAAEDIAFPRGQVTERGHRYYEELAKLSNPAWVATAAQRAEALLKTLGKWTD